MTIGPLLLLWFSRRTHHRAGAIRVVSRRQRRRPTTGSAADHHRDPEATRGSDPASPQLNRSRVEIDTTTGIPGRPDVREVVCRIAEAA
jgi:hypothetical protein